MAWACSATTNEGLVANLVKNNLVKTDAVAAAMRKVDRAWFVPPERAAYVDAPQPIGFNVTVSAPHMHAIMLEILAPHILQRASAAAPSEPGDGRATLRVLDVGSGSGYLTAVLAALCEAVTPQWQIVGVEHVKELQERSAKVLEEHWPAWGRAGQVRILHGDGRDPLPALRPLVAASQANAEGPLFDLIHVGAAADTVPPPLLAILKRGGCMVIPVGAPHETQQLLVCRKDARGEVAVTKDCLVSFVPLTSLASQRGNR